MATYTALGGSNTCGHGVPTRKAFQSLVFDGLRPLGAASLQPSCIPAMGPEYPASCLAYFAPNATRWATLEFSPNIGEGTTLERDLAFLAHIMRTLRRRRVSLAVVNLLPGGRGAPAFEANGERVVRLARAYRLPVVTSRYDNATWAADMRHLSEAGHAHVASQVLL